MLAQEVWVRGLACCSSVEKLRHVEVDQHTGPASILKLDCLLGLGGKESAAFSMSVFIVDSF